MVQTAFWAGSHHILVIRGFCVWAFYQVLKTIMCEHRSAVLFHDIFAQALSCLCRLLSCPEPWFFFAFNQIICVPGNTQVRAVLRQFHFTCCRCLLPSYRVKPEVVLSWLWQISVSFALVDPQNHHIQREGRCPVRSGLRSNPF